jgi:hypothetical protein
VASSLNYNASSDDEDDKRMTNDEANVQEVIVYNKREAFFSKPKLVTKRRSQRIAHVPCSMFCSKANQLCLVLSSGPFTRFSKA